jgi:hypothetical protein
MGFLFSPFFYMIPNFPTIPNLNLKNAAKLALHDSFVAYLQQSSATMKDTVDALATELLYVHQVDLLNAFLESTNVLLSNVNSPIF